MGKRKIKRKIGDYIDKAGFAVRGFRYLLSRPKYCTAFLSITLLLLYVLAQLQDGGAVWKLLFSKLSFDRKLAALGLSLQAAGRCFLSLQGWLLVLLAIMQALAICGIVYALRNRAKDQAINHASSGSIASVLAIVTLGCPTCGIGLMTPLLTLVVGSSAAALAERIGGFLMIAAFILLAITLIESGYLIFVTQSAKQAKEKHAKNH